MKRRSHLLMTVLLVAMLLSLLKPPSGSAQTMTGPSSPDSATQTTAPQPASPPRARRNQPSVKMGAYGGQHTIRYSPAVGGPTRSTPIGNPDDWMLTFADEFGGTSLNTTTWAREYGFDNYCEVVNPPPPGSPSYCNRSNNNEREWYIDDAHQVGGGSLKLIATRNDCSGDDLPDRKDHPPYTCANFPYLSGMISSRGGFSQMYGYFEARIKLPEGPGLWPAFWLLPQIPPTPSPVQYYWPPEIDIMEFKGQQVHNIFMTNIWSGVYPDPGSALNNWIWGDYAQTIYQNQAIDFTAGFHTYAIDWEPDAIVWYIDGVERARETEFLPPGLIDPPNFTGEMHLIFNLATGGNFVGNILPSDNNLPAALEIDYVRVYQKAARLGSERVYMPEINRDDGPAWVTMRELPGNSK